MSGEKDKAIIQTEVVTSSGEIIKFESSDDSATYSKAAESVKLLSITNGTLIDIKPDNVDVGRSVNNTGTSGDRPAQIYNLENLPLSTFAARVHKRRTLQLSMPKADKRAA